MVMLLVRYHITEIARILFIVFSINLFPSCTYKFHSWGYEQDVMQTLESGKHVSVRMINGDYHKLSVVELDQSTLTGTDEQKQMVVIPLSEIDFVRTREVDSKTVVIVGASLAAIAFLIWYFSNLAAPCIGGVC